MSQQSSTLNQELESLAEHARTFLEATADATGEKVTEARSKLASALEGGKKSYGRVREKVTYGAHLVDDAVQQNPYQAIVLGLGAGAIIGYLLSRRGSSAND